MSNNFNLKGQQHGYWQERDHFYRYIWYYGNYVNGWRIGYWQTFHLYAGVIDEIYYL